MIDPSQIDFTALPSMRYEERNFFPPVSAVYFVFDAQGLAYVGKTKNLFVRWRGHQKASELVGDVVVSWLECDDPDASDIECVCILHFSPRLNSLSAIKSHSNSSPFARMRKATGLTQVEFAQRIGLTSDRVSRLERGKVDSMYLEHWVSLDQLLSEHGYRFSDFVAPTPNF